MNFLWKCVFRGSRKNYFSCLSVKFIKLHKRLCCLWLNKKLDYQTKALAKESSPFFKSRASQQKQFFGFKDRSKIFNHTACKAGQ